MKRIKKMESMAKVILSVIVMIGLVLVMTGCASNQVRDVWNDPECLWQVQEAYFMGYGVGYDDAKSGHNYNPQD